MATGPLDNLTSAASEAERVDVFISYSQKDRRKVDGIAAALRLLKLAVWYDINLLPNQSFQAEIRRKVTIAKAVLVVWTDNSIDSSWVQSEALIGHREKKLVSSQIGSPPLPPPFNLEHAASLDDWNGEAANLAWRTILQSLGALLERGDSLIDWYRCHELKSPDYCRYFIEKHANDPLASHAKAFALTLGEYSSSDIKIEDSEVSFLTYKLKIAETELRKAQDSLAAHELDLARLQEQSLTSERVVRAQENELALLREKAVLAEDASRLRDEVTQSQKQLIDVQERLNRTERVLEKERSRPKSPARISRLMSRFDDTLFPPRIPDGLYWTPVIALVCIVLFIVAVGRLLLTIQ